MATDASRQLAATLGANIRAARIGKGWTQDDLGFKVGATGQRVSKWERGQHRPGPLYEVALADALFGGDVSELYVECAA